jgi:hypothetical protein
MLLRLKNRLRGLKRHDDGGRKLLLRRVVAVEGFVILDFGVWGIGHFLGLSV